MALVKRKKETDGASPLLFKRNKWEKVLFGVIFVIFLVYAVSLVFPFVWLTINSFQDALEFQLNSMLGEAFAFPEKWVMDNYTYAFNELEYEGTNIFGMFFNSIWHTACVACGGVLMCACTAYILSKYKFRGSDIIYTIIIFTMTIPVIGTSGATFKLAVDLGVYNTPFFILMTCLVGYGMNFLVLYGFFKNVSWSYAEAAFMDGATHFGVFVKVMLPQALPIMSTLIITSAIGAWNDYNTMLLYMPDYPTIASGLFNVSRILPRSGNTPAYYAALVISVVPILILFLCFSDAIMKNFSVGGLKG